MSTNAQFMLEGHLDGGNNNLSKGVYLQFSNIGYYERSYWGAQAGWQLGLVQSRDVFFNSWYINVYGKIPLGNLKLNVGGEYLWTAFSPEMREINWIVTAGTSLKHWRFVIGNNSRIYRLSNKTTDNDLSVDPDSRIIEGWNLMYFASFAVKPVENKWNITFAITDYDRFLIQQETNPMLNLRFDYKLNRQLNLYSELWYIGSGFLNMKVNYFGTLFRTGILWRL